MPTKKSTEVKVHDIRTVIEGEAKCPYCGEMNDFELEEDIEDFDCVNCEKKFIIDTVFEK